MKLKNKGETYFKKSIQQLMLVKNRMLYYLKKSAKLGYAPAQTELGIELVEPEL